MRQNLNFSYAHMVKIRKFAEPGGGQVTLLTLPVGAHGTWWFRLGYAPPKNYKLVIALRYVLLREHLLSAGLV